MSAERRAADPMQRADEMERTDPIDQVFALETLIRYVAIYRNGTLSSRQRGGIVDASAGESDRYEELLVNPALLTLARQRGDIDCGGALFVVVRYGHFYQLVLPIDGGHASVCFELAADPMRHAARIAEICEQG
jgi:hypothetical protein